MLPRRGLQLNRLVWHACGPAGSQMGKARRKLDELTAAQAARVAEGLAETSVVIGS